MKGFERMTRAALGFLELMIAVTGASAQSVGAQGTVRSTAAPVMMRAEMPGYAGVSIGNGDASSNQSSASANTRFSVRSGSDASQTIPISFHWNLNTSTSRSIELVAYFESDAKALSSGPNSIRGSQIQGSFDGAAFRTLNAGGLRLVSLPIASSNAFGSRKGALELRLDPASRDSIPDGDYQGVITIQLHVY
jgi:hypothetical protein